MLPCLGVWGRCLPRFPLPRWKSDYSITFTAKDTEANSRVCCEGEPRTKNHTHCNRHCKTTPRRENGTSRKPETRETVGSFHFKADRSCLAYAFPHNARRPGRWLEKVTTPQTNSTTTQVQVRNSNGTSLRCQILENRGGPSGRIGASRRQTAARVL